MTTLQAAARPRAADERRVLHAHLRPATPDGAWALRWALEDALRCASFDDFGRLVLVRRLRIEALPARCGSSPLTAAIERAWREAARSAVPALTAGDPGRAHEAVEAAAVWFSSPAAATLAALARVIDGVSLAGWFWPRAVPLLAASGGRDERIVGLVDELMAGAPAAAAQALPLWPQTRLDTLRGVLAAYGPALPEALRLMPAQARPPAAARAAPSPRHDDAPNGVYPSVGRLDGGVDEAPLGPAQPASPPPGASPPAGRESASERRRRPLTPIAASPPAVLSVRVDGRLPPRRPRAAPAPARHTGAAPAEAAADGPSPGARHAEPPTANAARAIDGVVSAGASQRSIARASVPTPRPMRPSMPLPWPWLHDARFSSHGGVLWLLNLLPALGFGSGTPTALVRALLAGLMDRAGLPAADPQRAILPAVPEAALLPATDPDVRRWLAGARRALRRRAGLSLVELASHPAWVTVTPTHADLVLPMTATDLRVRRLGLDRDPGWLPWLGRIVTFHFVAREDWPEPEMPDG